MSIAYPKLSEKMREYREEMAEKVEADSKQVVSDAGSR